MNSLSIINKMTGVIYAISSPSTNSIYIGSSFNHMRRYNGHLNQLNPNFNGYYCRSKDIVAQNDHKIEIVEYFICNTEKQLREREGWWQKNYNGLMKLVNKNIACRSQKQYRQDMKHMINKKYSCSDCGGRYTCTNLSHHVKTKRHVKALQQKNGN
jgi:excinuclease UvrABC ATPase subunit